MADSGERSQRGGVRQDREEAEERRTRSLRSPGICLWSVTKRTSIADASLIPAWLLRASLWLLCCRTHLLKPYFKVTRSQRWFCPPLEIGDFNLVEQRGTKRSRAGTCPGGASPVMSLPQGALLPSLLVSESSSNQMVFKGQDIVKIQSSSLVVT